MYVEQKVSPRTSEPLIALEGGLRPKRSAFPPRSNFLSSRIPVGQGAEGARRPSSLSGFTMKNTSSMHRRNRIFSTKWCGTQTFTALV